MSIHNRWLETLPTHQTHYSYPGSGIIFCKTAVRMQRVRYRLILWPQWKFLTAPQPTIASLSLHEGEMTDTDRVHESNMCMFMMVHPSNLRQLHLLKPHNHCSYTPCEP